MERLRSFVTFTSLLLSVSAPVAACAADRADIAGPVSAEILRIVDGDTFLVAANPWPQQTVEVLVRIRGIDAPEMQARCPALRAAAGAAKQHLAHLLERSPTIFLTNVAGDKYFGRVVADVHLEDGSNPTSDMVAIGLAQPYDGGRKPTEICRKGT